MDRLSDRARCVAPDQRGWGGSVVTDGRYDLAAMADDAETIIGALGLKRYILVGHSMGGKVAQIIAARLPQGLARLILIAPAPPTPMPVSEAQRAGMLASYDLRRALCKRWVYWLAGPCQRSSRSIVIEDSWAHLRLNTPGPSEA